VRHIVTFAFVALPALAAGHAGAQAPSAARDSAPRLVVTTFRGPDASLRMRATEAVRRELARAGGRERVEVVSGDAIAQVLDDAGYAWQEPLAEDDAVQLAKQLRAEVAVLGNARDSSGIVRLEATLTLARDPVLRQPVGPFVASSLDAAARRLAGETRKALAQLDGERECYRLSRDGRFAEAIAAARAGERRYRRATIAPVCRLRAMVERKDDPAAVLAVAEAVVAIDSSNKVALANAAEIHLSRGDTARAMATTWRLLVLSPPRLLECSMFPCSAPPLVVRLLETLLARESLAPDELKVAWALAHATRQWRIAAELARRLEAAEPAAADTAFYLALANLYAADSQPQKAAETLARGTARFPRSAGLWVSYGTALRGAGQNQQAVHALRRALAADPKARRARLVMAQLYLDIDQPDSALGAIRAGVAAGDERASLGHGALALGNTLYRATNGQQELAAKRAGFLRALSFLALADSLRPAETSKFLLGVTAFQLGLGYAQEAQAAVKAKKNAAACAATRSANEHFATAQINVPQGGPANQQAMGQIMQAIRQYTPVLESWQGQYCR
jgi:tetratricopeptide (TPR) repeat protein